MEHTEQHKALYRTIVPRELRKGDLKKLEIISAAVDCLGEDGIKKFTYDTIAKRSGNRISHIAYHFPRLEGLLETSFRFVFSSLQSTIAEYLSVNRDEKKTLDTYIKAHFEWLKHNPTHGKAALYFYYQAIIDKNYRTITTESLQLGKERIQLMAKSLRPELKPTELYSLSDEIQAHILGGLMMFLCTNRAPSERKARLQMLKSVYSLILNW